MALAKPAFICAAKRTAFGAFGGKLKTLSATDLGVVAANAAIKSIDLDPTKIDSVIIGNVMQVRDYFSDYLIFNKGGIEHHTVSVKNR